MPGGKEGPDSAGSGVNIIIMSNGRYPLDHRTQNQNPHFSNSHGNKFIQETESNVRILHKRPENVFFQVRALRFSIYLHVLLINKRNGVKVNVSGCVLHFQTCWVFPSTGKHGAQSEATGLRCGNLLIITSSSHCRKIWILSSSQ